MQRLIPYSTVPHDNSLVFRCVILFAVPNVSFEVYSPSFLDKLIESHSVMTQVRYEIYCEKLSLILRCMGPHHVFLPFF